MLCRSPCKATFPHGQGKGCPYPQPVRRAQLHKRPRSQCQEFRTAHCGKTGRNALSATRHFKPGPQTSMATTKLSGECPFRKKMSDAGINRFCTVFSTRLRGSRFQQFRRCAAPCVHSRAHSAGVHARPAAALPSVRAVSKLRPSAARNLPARAGGSAL